MGVPSMFATFALAAALAQPAHRASAPTNAFLRDFAGTWNCRAPGQPASRWRIVRVRGSRWVRVDWGLSAAGIPAGSAFVGYITQRQHWVYRDFHADGSYANMHGVRAGDGTWSWTGPYDPANAKAGNAPLEGLITWRRIDATHIARTFMQRLNGTTIPRGSDRCTLRQE